MVKASDLNCKKGPKSGRHFEMEGKLKYPYTHGRTRLITERSDSAVTTSINNFKKIGKGVRPKSLDRHTYEMPDAQVKKRPHLAQSIMRDFFKANI